jgi:hypothetical protein
MHRVDVLTPIISGANEVDGGIEDEEEAASAATAALEREEGEDANEAPSAPEDDDDDDGAGAAASGGVNFKIFTWKYSVLACWPPPLLLLLSGEAKGTSGWRV